MNYDKAPFPWFGGKSRAASAVWAALGDVDHFVEPFAGSLAVLLNRPHKANRPYRSETVNDLDGLVVNFWRAVQWHPEATAEAASWPVTEADKQARQIALLRWRDAGALDRLAGDAMWCDPIMAGWWAWAVAVQIGAIGGSWTADRDSGRIFRQHNEPGASRDRPHLGNNGQGVNNAGLREPGVSRDRPFLGNNGRGVNRPAMREPGVLDDPVAHGGGTSRLDRWQDWGGDYHDLTMPSLIRWFRHLAARLRHVRIVNGDWARVVTTGAAYTLSVRQGGVCGVFLDPPYAATAGRMDNLYLVDDLDVAHAVADWAIANTDTRWARIVVAGFAGEHDTRFTDAGWTEVEWFTDGFLTGGMGNVGAKHQQHRERLWLSPQCLGAADAHEQLTLT